MFILEIFVTEEWTTALSGYACMTVFADLSVTMSTTMSFGTVRIQAQCCTTHSDDPLSLIVYFMDLKLSAFRRAQLCSPYARPLAPSVSPEPRLFLGKQNGMDGQ